MKLGCFAGGLALLLIASAPSSAQDAKPKISDPKLRVAVARFEEASDKFPDDPEPWIACWSKRDDALDLGTAGGFNSKGFAEISKRAKMISEPRLKTKRFKHTFEYVSVVETKELACVVCISGVAPTAEKQGDTALAFRSTLVFRLEDGEWKLVIRHFDTLVNERKRAEQK